MATSRSVHVPALAAYVVAVLGFTFPLVLRFTSHMVGDGDCQLFVWELWWFHKAVFELHQSPLTTSLLFFPTPSIPLIWSTPYNIVLGMGLVGWLGPVVTYNLLVTTGLWLAAAGAYFLAWHVTRRRDAAFLAGLIYAFAPAHMMHVRGHLGVMSVQWAPWCALALFRLYEAPSWKRAGVFAVALALAASVDVYVSLYFLGAFLPLFAAYHLWTQWERATDPRFLGKAVVAGLAALAVVVPFFLPMLRHINGSASALEQAKAVHLLGQDVLQWILPPFWHPMFWGLSGSVSRHITDLDTWGYLGWSVILLSGYALVRARGTAFWALFTASTMVLALGTNLRINGSTGIPMPYLLATKLPLLSNLRCPGRFMEVAALGLAMLAALGLAAWAPARNRLVFAAVAAAVVVEYTTFAPFPTLSAAVPPFYEQLAHDPTARGILELPNGDPTYGGPTYRWMYFQTHHGHPLVAAHTHRIPDGAMDFIEHTPAVRDLYHRLDAYYPMTPEQKRTASADLARAGITHVIVHRVPGYLDGAGYDRLEALVAGLFGPPVAGDAAMAVHRTHL